MVLAGERYPAERSVSIVQKVAVGLGAGKIIAVPQLEVGRLQSSFLRNASQHRRPQIIAVGKCPGIVGEVGMTKFLVGTNLPEKRPPISK